MLDYDGDYVDGNVKEIIVMSLENIEDLHIEIAISRFIQITKSLSYFSIEKIMIHFLVCKNKAKSILK